MRGLENRLGVRLLTRTTRKSEPTEAGERMFKSVAPRFEVIDAAAAAVKELHDKPVGTIRITSAEHAAKSVLWAKLAKAMEDHPCIIVEITVDYTKSDIASRRFDAGDSRQE